MRKREREIADYKQEAGERDGKESRREYR